MPATIWAWTPEGQAALRKWKEGMTVSDDPRLIPGHTLEECFDLLSSAVNEDDQPDCDEGCDSYAHTPDCDERTSSAAMLMRQQELIESLRVEIEGWQKLFAGRSHACSGRDCVGLYQDETGSLHRCTYCDQVRHLLAESTPTPDPRDAEIEWLRDDKAVLMSAMNSIANSSCCGDCREAKRVAVQALADLADDLSARLIREAIGEPKVKALQTKGKCLTCDGRGAIPVTPDGQAEDACPDCTVTETGTK